MQKFLDVLKRCPLFFDLSDDDIMTMLDCLKARTDVFNKTVLFSRRSLLQKISELFYQVRYR